jgi:hypothetical protein
MATNRHRKVAIDDIAKKYWEEYFKDSGYGSAWVREIPRKIKAHLSTSRAASFAHRSAALSEPDIRPYAQVINDQGVSIEAFAVYPNKKVVAFVIDFDHDGDVVDFKAVPA